jgi:PAS domain S-box-containing protein
MPKIMIVDDDVTVQMELEEYLNHMDYTVVGIADTGAGAVETAREMKPDLILMDINLPGEMDGISAAQKISEEMDVAVVFITGFGDPEYIERAKRVEPFGYVMKPFDEKEINGVIEIVLHKRKMELELKAAHDRLERANLDLQGEIEARKKAEKVLLERDERYTALFDRSIDCIYIHDFEGNFIDANPAALKLFGYIKDEIRSLNFASLLSQDQIPALLKVIEELKTTGFYEGPLEYKLVSKNGEAIYVETKASVIYRDGAPYAIQGIARDIKDRKLSEEALRESEKRARQYLDIAGVAFVALDDEGNITLLNKRGLEILGYGGEELLGKNWFKTCLPERMTDDVLDVYHQLIRGEVEPVEYYENPVLTKDGKERIIAWHNSTLRDPAGEIVGILSSGEDITDRLLADEALKESEEKYRSMMEAMIEPIVICSPDFRVEYMNPAMIRRTGRDAIGEHCYKALHDLEEKCPWCMHDKTQQGEYLELEIVSPKDNRSYHISQAPIAHGDGSVSKLTIFRDITEMRETQAQLYRAQKMEAMGLLAGGVAHDLNNILSGIVSYPELLLMDLPEDSPLWKPIKTIQESGMRAADVVADLLTIARGVATGKETLNLNTLITEYLESPEYQKLDKTHSFVNFETELDSDLLNMSGSSTHIKKTLMNLVINASEAIEGRGTVTISSMNRYLDEPLKGYEGIRTGEYAVLSVSDDGSGIIPQDLERIFEPFYTKKVMGRSGTGLGLAVVWNTVQDHNGYINVESSKKRTVFELYFPVTRKDVSDEKEKTPLENYLGHGEKILVVDDEERQRVIACGILTKLG